MRRAVDHLYNQGTRIEEEEKWVGLHTELCNDRMAKPVED